MSILHYDPSKKLQYNRFKQMDALNSWLDENNLKIKIVTFSTCDNYFEVFYQMKGMPGKKKKQEKKQENKKQS